MSNKGSLNADYGLGAGLTLPQQAALDLTCAFMAKLFGNTASSELALEEGYKFCQAALRGDTVICGRMDEAASILGRAALVVGIHPEQVVAAQRMSSREERKQ